MRIDRKELIGGLPSTAVRDFLRAVGTAQWDVAYAAARLRVRPRQAAQVVKQLLELGCVESVSNARGEVLYRRTLTGSTFAQASAARPLKRSTADRKLAEFLDRARRINDDDHYLYRVKKAVVFGSYLTQADRIGDVAVELVPRWQDPEKQSAMYDARIKEAMRSGRRFANIGAEVSWPQNEVYLALKDRSRAISLHPADDAILKRAACRVVFEGPGAR